MTQYCRCPAWRTSIMSREAGHNAVLHAGHRQYWHCWMGQPRDQAVGEAIAEAIDEAIFEATVEAIAEAKKVTISSGLDPTRLCSKLPRPLQQWHCNDLAVLSNLDIRPWVRSQLRPRVSKFIVNELLVTLFRSLVSCILLLSIWLEVAPSGCFLHWVKM